MDKLMDEIVKVNVTDATSTVTQTSVNTMAIVGAAGEGKESAVAAACSTLNDEGDESSVKALYGADSELYKLAGSFFGETEHPDQLVCIPGSVTSSGIADILDGVDSKLDFYHVVVRVPSTADKAEVVALVTAINTWCNTNFKCAHVEIADYDLAISVVQDETYTKILSKRVGVYFHSETSGASYAVALCASRCANDPARGTWAHKTIDSITADSITKAKLAASKAAGLNLYAQVGGTNRSFFGFAGSASLFIDSCVKKDWIKFRVQEAIYDLLGNANDGDGVNYDDAGIQSVGGAITSILTTAADQDHRYILDGTYEVSVPAYADIAAAKKASRVLPDVKATFELMNSIHTVDAVRLVVTL